eukprot:2780856-Lingulodinium_polyedra.AAC.1
MRRRCKRPRKPPPLPPRTAGLQWRRPGPPGSWRETPGRRASAPRAPARRSGAAGELPGSDPAWRRRGPCPTLDTAKNGAP